MYVEVGNDKAIEGYRDPTSDDPDLVRFRPLEGQHTTTIVIPEGMGLQEAFTSAVTALQYHLSEGGKPVWIESDSEGLQALLMENYGITKAQNNRPADWGADIETPEVPAPAPGDGGEA